MSFVISGSKATLESLNGREGGFITTILPLASLVLSYQHLIHTTKGEDGWL